MRYCLHLLLLVMAFTYHVDIQAHGGRDTVTEGVRWHGHQHTRASNRPLFNAFGNRTIWGVRERHLHRYEAYQRQLTAYGYDDVLVIYNTNKNRRRYGHISIGIAHAFSSYRPDEVVIEQFDHARSQVIDVDAIRGVLLSHAKGYRHVTFSGRVLEQLHVRWRRHFPRNTKPHHIFYGRVVAIFSDDHQLVEAYSVRKGRNNMSRLRNRPVALLHKDDLRRQRLPRPRPRG